VNPPISLFWTSYIVVLITPGPAVVFWAPLPDQSAVCVVREVGTRTGFPRAASAEARASQPIPCP
jgi:hypothetical protein